MRMSIILPLLLGVLFTTFVLRERHIHFVAQNLKPYSVIEKSVNEIHDMNVKIWNIVNKEECRPIKLGATQALKSLFDKSVKLILLAPLMDDNKSDNDRQYIFMVPISKANPCIERVLILEREVGMLGGLVKS